MRSLTPQLLIPLTLLISILLTTPVEAQPIALVYIKVVDTAGRPIPGALLSISPESDIERTDTVGDEGIAGIFIFQEKPWSWGTYKVKVQDAILNPLETDPSEVTFSKPSEVFTITVKDARLISVDVKEDGGVPPIAALLVVVGRDIFAHPFTYTKNGNIGAFPVKKSYTGNIYIGSPLRRTTSFTPPPGEDFKAEVTLKPVASLNFTLVDGRAILKLGWQGVEPQDLGQFANRVPYVITVNFTLPNGRSSDHASPDIYLTTSPGEYQGRFTIEKEWENSTVTIGVSINLSFFRPEGGVEDAIRAYGDPWLERMANVEDPFYHHPILKATYSLEAIQLRAKYASALDQIKSLQNQVKTLDRNLAELTARYEDVNRTYTSLRNRLISAEANATSLADQLSQANASITSLQGRLAEAEGRLTSIDAELKSAKDQLNTTNTIYLPLAAGVPAVATVILAALYIRKGGKT